MNITHRSGNLLEQPDIDVIVHQANLYHTFGAGIAKAIKEKFPRAYEADLMTRKGTTTKLGNFSIGITDPTKPVVVNLYSQRGMSLTSYDAMAEGLGRLALILSNLPSVKRVGFPYGMGCGLADGNWEIVKTIIEQAFKDTDFEIVIVKLPEA